MIRKTLILAAAVLALSAAPAGAWTSDTFRSPTGNLVCKYRYNIGAITCGSHASQKVIHLRRYGRPVEGAALTWGAGTYWPVLAYGESWNTGAPISCRSLFSGMRCQNSDGWYFIINRSRVYVGRYGQLLYWL